MTCVVIKHLQGLLSTIINDCKKIVRFTLVMSYLKTDDIFQYLINSVSLEIVTG